MNQQEWLKSVVITLSLFFFIISPVHSNTLVVNQSTACTVGVSYYTTIGDALGNSSDNDTIKVCDGTFNENLIINTQIRLTGFSRNASRVIINATTQGASVIQVHNDSVEISYLTLMNTSGGSIPAIKLDPAFSTNNGNASYNIFKILEHGIEADGTLGLTINKNTFEQSTGFNSAIVLKNAQDVNITNNNFIGVDDSTELILFGSGTTNTKTSNNTFTVTGSTVIIKDSSIGSQNHEIYNNFFNISSGTFISTLLDTPVLNVTRIEDTNIIGGPYRGGNGWFRQDGTGFSDTCNDTDLDGICDTIYTISANEVDYLPLTSPPSPPAPPTPSSISQSFGNISEMLLETVKIFPPMLTLLISIIVLVFIGIIIKFIRGVFERIISTISTIGGKEQ
jgi:hypothetical protein